jgi:hypothetical protein
MLKLFRCILNFFFTPIWLSGIPFLKLSLIISDVGAARTCRLILLRSSSWPMTIRNTKYLSSLNIFCMSSLLVSFKLILSWLLFVWEVVVVDIMPVLI